MIPSNRLFGGLYHVHPFLPVSLASYLRTYEHKGERSQNEPMESRK